MKKRSTTTAAALAATALVITGCSGSDESQATPEPAETIVVTETAEPPAAAEPGTEGQTDQAEVGTDEEYQPIGTRSEPYDQGETATLAHWDITITDAHVKESPEPDFEYPLDLDEGMVIPAATIEFTNTADEDSAESPRKWFTISYVGASGSTYSEESLYSSQSWGRIGTLYGGASGSGDLLAIAPSDEVDDGVWLVEYHNADGLEPLHTHFDATPSN